MCYDLTTNFTLSVPETKPEIRFLQVNATTTSVTLMWTANDFDYDVLYEISYDGKKRKILNSYPLILDGLRPSENYTGLIVAHVISEFFFPKQLEVANITFRTEPETVICGNPQLSANGKDVKVTCPVPKTFVNSVTCTFYKKSGNNNAVGLDRHQVTPRLYCEERCHNVCILTMSVISLGPGRHRFKVSISEDDFHYTVDSNLTEAIVLEHPLPQIDSTCPHGEGQNAAQGYIKEGTTAFCDCSLLKKGYPKGRARWLNSSNEEVGTQYDGVKTTISVNFDPNDPRQKYVCQGVSVLGEGETNSTFSPHFAYGPESVDAVVPTHVSLCPQKKEPIEISCRIDIRTASPEPKVVLKIGDSLMAPAKLYLGYDLHFDFTFFPNKSGDINGVCLATNGIYTDINVQKAFRTRVFESPSSAPKVSIANQSISDSQIFYLSIGHPVQVMCDVVGGFPEVTHVQLACGPSQLLKVTGTQLVHTITIDDNDIRSITCSCSALHPSMCYDLTTNFTLSVPEGSDHLNECTNTAECVNNLKCVSGKCQCDKSIRNYYEHSEKTCKNAKYSGPTFLPLQEENLIPIEHGRPVTLTCRFNLTHTKPVAKVTWMYNGNRIRDDKAKDESTIFESSSNVMNNTCANDAATIEFIYEFVLNVTRFTPALLGNYSCKVEGFPEHDNLIISNEMLISPEVTLSPASVNVPEGREANLFCHFRNVTHLDFEVNDITKDRINVTKGEEGAPYSFQPTNSSSKVRCIGYFKYGYVTSNVVNVTLYSNSSRTCEEDLRRRGYNWTATPISSVAYVSCPIGYTGHIQRKCTATGEWEEPKFGNCSKKELLAIEKKVATFKEVQPSSNVIEETAGELSESLNKSDHLLSTDISKTVDILSAVSNLTSNDESNETLVTSKCLENMADISDKLLSSSEKDWDELEEMESSRDKTGTSQQLIGAKLLVAMENLTVASLKESNFSSAPIIKDNIVIQRDVIGRNNTADIVFPKYTQEEGIERNNDTVCFVTSSLKDADKENLKYSALLFKGIKQIQTSQDYDKKKRSVQSNILAFSLNKKIGETKIELSFQQTALENYSDPICGFLDTRAEKLGTWSADGCHITGQESGLINCSCDHLTNFAVLMSLSRPHASHRKALDVISVIGCVVSILCLTALIIVYAFLWRSLKKERKLYLHVALSSCLLLVYIVFLAGVNRSPHEPDCTFVASLLHYLLLVVFCLMLCEGVEILIAVVFIFAPPFPVWYHFVPAFSVPLLIVSISLGVTEAQNYRSEDVCWLNISTGTLWTFLAPALAVILANFVILGVALYVLMNTVTVKGKDNIEKAKLGVKSVAILSPILGLTWIFGILAVDSGTVVFQYLFAICNSFQGVSIFIFYCVLVHQVRDASRAFKRKRSFRSLDSRSFRNTSQKSTTDQTVLPTTSINDSEFQEIQNTRVDAEDKNLDDSSCPTLLLHSDAHETAT